MDFRRLLVVTTVTTAITALLGVYTAVAGAGLTCEARWPLCDGAVFGLFPANFMSFIEWFHRLVAMVTGFLIIGSTIAGWRGRAQRRVRFALLVAVLLTPLQIVLGALTVTTYEIAILTAHFGAASLILGSLVAATVWAYTEVTAVSLDRIQQAGVGALLGFPAMVALTPRLFVTFGELVQFLYYGLGFTMFSALVVMALWGRELGASRVAATGGTAAVLLVVKLIVARQAFGSEGQLAILGLSFAAFALTLGAVWQTRTLTTGTRISAPAGD